MQDGSSTLPASMKTKSSTIQRRPIGRRFFVFPQRWRGDVDEIHFGHGEHRADVFNVGETKTFGTFHRSFAMRAGDAAERCSWDLRELLRSEHAEPDHPDTDGHALIIVTCCTKVCSMG